MDDRFFGWKVSFVSPTNHLPSRIKIKNITPLHYNENAGTVKHTITYQDNRGSMAEQAANYIETTHNTPILGRVITEGTMDEVILLSDFVTTLNQL